VRKLWQTFVARLRPPTLVELLTVIAILSVLVTLLIQPVKWASSGSIDLKVRVFVFDAVKGKPISGARVGILNAPAVRNQREFDDYGKALTLRLDDLSETDRSVTDEDGMATLEYRFHTGANYERPVTHVHLPSRWVLVEAAGYSGVFVPVRYESEPVGPVRKAGELPVMIGLVRNG
jgi:hypothetical protein